MTRAVAQALNETQRRCSHCGKIKPTESAFWMIRCRNRPASWCKRCVNIAIGLRRETPEYKARLKEYLARPDVQERRKIAQHKYLLKRDRERDRAYRQKPKSKLLHGRRAARRGLKAAGITPERRARLEARIASYDREIARIERSEDAEERKENANAKRRQAAIAIRRT